MTLYPLEPSFVVVYSDLTERLQQMDDCLEVDNCIHLSIHDKNEKKIHVADLMMDREQWIEREEVLLMEEEWMFLQEETPLHLLLPCELLQPTFPSIDALLPPSDLPSASACLLDTHFPSSTLQKTSDSLASCLCMLIMKLERLRHQKPIVNTTVHSNTHSILDEISDRYRLSLLHIVNKVDDNSPSMNHIPVATVDIVRLRFASHLPNVNVAFVLPTQ